MSPPRIAFVENYDSFSFSLVAQLALLGAEPIVVQNDELTLSELVALRCAAFVISPGPCTPKESGVSLDLAQHALAGRLGRPLLGVCLGQQAIAQAAGGCVVRAAKPMHGKVSVLDHDGLGLFAGLPQKLTIARYNSLVVAPELPDCLVATGWSDGELMALSHRELPITAVQFHPESHLAEHGDRMLRNWLTMIAAAPRAND